MCQKMKAQVDPVDETTCEGGFEDEVNGSGDHERRRTCQDRFRILIILSFEQFG